MGKILLLLRFPIPFINPNYIILTIIFGMFIIINDLIIKKI